MGCRSRIVGSRCGRGRDFVNERVRQIVFKYVNLLRPLISHGYFPCSRSRFVKLEETTILSTMVLSTLDEGIIGNNFRSFNTDCLEGYSLNKILSQNGQINHERGRALIVPRK